MKEKSKEEKEEVEVNDDDDESCSDSSSSSASSENENDDGTTDTSSSTSTTADNNEDDEGNTTTSSSSFEDDIIDDSLLFLMSGQQRQETTSSSHCPRRQEKLHEEEVEGRSRHPHQHDDQLSQHQLSNFVEEGVNHEEVLVRNWTQRVPIGMNLCPWAIQSQSKQRIRYVTTTTTTDCSNGIDVEQTLVEEAQRLLLLSHQHHLYEPYHTTLLICPHVLEWKGNNYEQFDTWVKKQQENLNTNPNYPHLHNQITLVSFHPQYSKWYDLPKDIKVGSQVYCSKGIPGVQKEIATTTTTFSADDKEDQQLLLPSSSPSKQDNNLHHYYYKKATIIETNSSRMFGKRKVKVRYDPNDDVGGSENHEDGTDNAAGHVEYSKKRFERYVPVDWLVVPGDDGNSVGGNTTTTASSTATTSKNRRGPLLIDNMMHRTPFPTIHLINNLDLVHLSLRDVSRVKRHNIQRMMKLEKQIIRKREGENEMD